MITRIMDNLNDWDHNFGSRPDSLTIFVSEAGYEIVQHEFSSRSRIGPETPHRNPMIEQVPVTIDPMLDGSEVRVTPEEIDEKPERFVERPLIHHLVQVVEPRQIDGMWVAAPQFRFEVPCREHEVHMYEKEVGLVTDDVTDLYIAVAQLANETMDGIEFKGVYIG